VTVNSELRNTTYNVNKLPKSKVAFNRVPMYFKILSTTTPRINYSEIRTFWIMGAAKTLFDRTFSGTTRAGRRYYYQALCRIEKLICTKSKSSLRVCYPVKPETTGKIQSRHVCWLLSDCEITSIFLLSRAEQQTTSMALDWLVCPWFRRFTHHM